MISGIHIFQVPISFPEGTPSAQTVSQGMTAYNYTYDANGNMLSDQLNRTGSIKYDHRNLMTEIRVIKSESPNIFEPPVDVLYITQYRYDEAGNRVRKVRYKYTGSEPDPVFDVSGDAPPWTMQSDEFYVRDVSGKEIAIYTGSSLTQWNIWGLDNVGKINSDTTRNYYLKDHLGSIRVVLNSTNGVVSAQDYDCWGYQLENRSYNSSAMKYDFTGKERDDETSYDYFGVRYYDSRIGRWGQVEPLLDKYPGFSSYIYSANNPIIFKDFNGEEIDLSNIQNYAYDIKSNLEYITGLSLDIQDNKIVNITTDYSNLKGSETARNILIKALGEDYEINVSQTDENTETIGSDIKMNPEMISNFMTGARNVEANTMGWAMTLLHELHHTPVGGSVKGDPKEFGEIGSIEKIMNDIRGELTKSYGKNFGQRTSYIGRGFKGKDKIYFPFDDKSRDKLMKGKKPSYKNSYIEYKMIKKGKEF